MPYYGQNGEDYLLWQLFKDQETPGTFVEVGALDGMRFSNTLMFEQAGWQGICVEAHPDYIDLLRKNRPKSRCVFAAAGDSNSDVTFYTNARGSLSTLEPALKSHFEKYGKDFTGFKPVIVPMRTLNTILEEAGFGSPLDILSVDVEGAELRVLKGLDLQKYQPRVLVIEGIMNKHMHQVNDYLFQYGYTLARILGPNMFFTSSSKDTQLIVSTQADVTVTRIPHPLDTQESRKQEVISLAEHTRSLPPRSGWQQKSWQIHGNLIKAARKTSIHLLRGISRYFRPRKARKRTSDPVFELGFHGDRYLLDLIGMLMPQVQNFVETGSNVGSTLGYVARTYPHLTLYSCEPDAQAFNTAREHTKSYDNVHLSQALSPEFLYTLHQKHGSLAQECSFYWLDAHSNGYKWPLYDEIAYITTNVTGGIIAVDDVKIPNRPEFTFMKDGDQVCDIDYIIRALAGGKQYTLVYPAYTEHTSRHHSLVGVCFVLFGDRITVPAQLDHFVIKQVKG